MYYSKGERENFVIQVREEGPRYGTNDQARKGPSGPPKASLFAPMRFFDRFRKVLMHFMFLSPPNSSRHKSNGRPPIPHRQSTDSHYPEAVADCIEFFNKSSNSRDVSSFV
ncbi:hypothetical protein AMTR_s00267p00007870 [Amborella trichopoda]|uniref:Uncharacterized protein n=1 Tax=Amborella trichopoda TaxID=13333 RepID=W1NFB9_AMBTC|nr:hypothetical protein AMTR_s00267p00007870 [Amborella trichopoda]